MLKARDFLDEDRDLLRDALGGYADWFGFNGDGPVTELVQASTTSGTALLLTDRATLSGCFPDAFLFPVRWEKREEHAVCLPAGILAQADMVLAAYGEAAKGWKLAALDASLAGVNLSKMPIGGNSGCASLAAALATALRGIRTISGVFASAGWDSGVLAQVGGIKVKVGLLGRLGVESVFYVHSANGQEAREHASASVSVRVFETPGAPSKLDNSIRTQVRGLTDALGQLPTVKEHGLDACITVFNAPDWASAPKRMQYYLDEIAWELSLLLRQRAGIGSWGDTFILLYNPIHDTLATNWLSMVRPEKVVMIRQRSRNTQHDDDAQGEKAEKFITAAGFDACRYRLVAVDPRAPKSEVLNSIDEIVDAVNTLGGECRFVDVQGATTFLRAIGYAVARRIGATPLGLEQVWEGPNLLCASDAKIQDLSFVIEDAAYPARG